MRSCLLRPRVLNLAIPHPVYCVSTIKSLSGSQSGGQSQAESGNKVDLSDPEKQVKVFQHGNLYDLWKLNCNIFTTRFIKVLAHQIDNQNQDRVSSKSKFATRAALLNADKILRGNWISGSDELAEHMSQIATPPKVFEPNTITAG